MPVSRPPLDVTLLWKTDLHPTSSLPDVRSPLFVCPVFMLHFSFRLRAPFHQISLHFSSIVSTRENHYRILLPSSAFSHSRKRWLSRRVYLRFSSLGRREVLFFISAFLVHIRSIREGVALTRVSPWPSVFVFIFAYSLPGEPRSPLCGRPVRQRETRKNRYFRLAKGKTGQVEAWAPLCFVSRPPGC